MNAAPPVVHLDESGNTGENLTDPAQPIFTLGAVHLEATIAARLAGVLAGENDEGHYIRLRRSTPGRRRVIEVLTDGALSPGENARVNAMHKPTMIPAKFVDIVIEPAVDAHGGDLYAGGGVVMATDILLTWGPTVCATSWTPMLDAFIAAARHPTIDTAAHLSRQMMAAIEESDGHPIQTMLLWGLAGPLDLLDRLIARIGGRADHLYPEVALAAEQIYWWGDKLSASIDVVYDESKVLARWQARFLSIADPAEAARYRITESTDLGPLPLAAMEPARSHDAPGLQVADTLAGACAEVLRCEARGETPSDWVAELERAGVRKFVGHMVWREVESMTDGS
jgi:hypothetical protein